MTNLYKRRFIVLIVYVFFNICIFSQEAEYKSFEKIKIFIEQQKYNEARIILVKIKNNFENTVLIPITNYYLSKIEFNQKNYYQALYFIELSLFDKNFKNLPLEIQADIKYFAGQIYYLAGLYSKSYDILIQVIDTDFEDKNHLNLYLSDILFRKKEDKQKIKKFLLKIYRSKLNNEEKEIFDNIASKILWEKIDTSIIAFKDPNVSDIKLDNNSIYFGLWNGGFIEYNQIQKKYKYYFGRVVSDAIRFIHVNSNFIYVGTDLGVSQISKTTGEIINLLPLKNKSITSITESKTRIYFGTLREGIVVYDKRKNIFYKISENLTYISGVFVIDNQVYVTTYNCKLYNIINNKLVQIVRKKMPLTPITDMIKINNKLYLSTFGEGIFIYDLLTKTFSHYPVAKTRTEENYCLTIAENQNKIYCGTLGKGIFIFDKNNKNFTQFKIPEIYNAIDIKKIIFDNKFMYIGLLGEGILKKDVIYD